MRGIGLPLLFILPLCSVEVAVRPITTWTRFTLQEVHMLWTIFVALIILWLLGFTLHIGGGLIHLLLVIGLIVLIINLVGGRRSAI